MRQASFGARRPPTIRRRLPTIAVRSNARAPGPSISAGPCGPLSVLRPHAQQIHVDLDELLGIGGFGCLSIARIGDLRQLIEKRALMGILDHALDPEDGREPLA